MRLLILIGLLSLLFSVRTAAVAADYRVGDRLSPVKSSRVGHYRSITWEDLLPKGWEPGAELKGLNLSRLSDADPRAIELLDKIKQAWGRAPVEASLDGARVKLAGFVVPLERKGNAVLELLLVPYFGACIHTPPPPANQIVHVVLNKPVDGINTMDALWISGTLKLQRGDSSLGVYGYRMSGDRLDAYGLPKGGK